MPRDRRARRSLPSAVERNLSLGELLGDDAAKRHARRRKSQEAQQRAALDSLNAYFAMIDQTELKVEKAPTPPPSPVVVEEDQDEDAKAASDSELVRPTVSTACRTQRTVRRRNLQDKALRAEYQVYCEATGGVVKPRSIEEFTRSIEPEVKKGMYEGILDVCPA